MTPTQKKEEKGWVIYSKLAKRLAHTELFDTQKEAKSVVKDCEYCSYPNGDDVLILKGKLVYEKPK